LFVLEITLRAQAVPRALLRVWLKGLVPAIAALVGRHSETPVLMHYYWDTIAACVPPETILAGIAAAGFVDVERQVELAMFSAYRARKSP